MGSAIATTISNEFGIFRLWLIDISRVTQPHYTNALEK